MIGFEEQVSRRHKREDESLETQSLEKKPVYDMLAVLYCLPPYGSRAVTREYLIGVHRGDFFRVRQAELRQFEVDLTPALTKRNGDPNNALLVKKLGVLLAAKGLQPLGFDATDPPDTVGAAHQNWLFRIARFVDPTNLAELFEKAVVPEPPLTPASDYIAHIYHGRRRASRFFFQVPGSKANKKFWDALKAVSAHHKLLLSHQMTVDVLTNALRDAKSKQDDLHRALADLVSKTALTYVGIQHPHVGADTILKGLEQEHPEVRDAVNKACEM